MHSEPLEYYGHPFIHGPIVAPFLVQNENNQGGKIHKQRKLKQSIENN